MPKRNAPLLAVTTCGSRAEAQRIARAVVERRLAACANIVTAPVQSVYRWKGKLENAKEWLLLMKTTAAGASRLEKEIQRLHTYEVPEFIVLEISGGSRAYLSWIVKNVS